VAGFAAGIRWRVDVLHRDIDDALHAADQKALQRTVEFGHHQVTGVAVVVFQPLRVADGHSQVQHRDRAAADIGNARKLAGQAGHLEQLGPAQDLLHLEHIDAEQLSSTQTEQQQGQAVVAGQTGALVNTVEQIMCHALAIGHRRADLNGVAGMALAWVVP
jgi:hypothetical protein